jgi:DNA-damage-inducible protein D
MKNKTKIALFKNKEIRKTIHNNEWWFVMSDVILVLTDSINPSDYLKKMRKRDNELAKGWGQIVTPLLIDTAGGNQKLNCSNTEGVFRIIQSIPSPKAEPFKRWLAKVGYERVQEIEDPELAVKRTKAIYRIKGYTEEWIERRIQGIKIREELTDEWFKRGIKQDKEYAILTSEIHKAALGMKPAEHKKLKGLKKENLRDHMTTLEHLFSQLGEESTKEITKTIDAEGFNENQQAAKKGGKIAGDARENLEKQTGRVVTSRESYSHLVDNKEKPEVG